MHEHANAVLDIGAESVTPNSQRCNDLGHIYEDTKEYMRGEIQDLGRPESGMPDPGRDLVAAGLDLLDGVVDQAFVVRLRHVPLQDL